MSIGRRRSCCDSTVNPTTWSGRDPRRCGTRCGPDIPTSKSTCAGPRRSSGSDGRSSTNGSSCTTAGRFRGPVAIVDGTVYRGFLWIFQDLTQVTMVAEREHLLEVEQRQNIRLRELDSLKSDLVASVSHELRTPLTSIMSFTKLLLDGLGVDAVTDQAESSGSSGGTPNGSSGWSTTSCCSTASSPTRRRSSPSRSTSPAWWPWRSLRSSPWPTRAGSNWSGRSPAARRSRGTRGAWPRWWTTCWPTR